MTSGSIKPIRVAVLVSGRGTNLQAIIDDMEQDDSPARIAVVICNHPGAPAIERARGYGIACEVISTRKSSANPQPHEEMLATLKRYLVDLVVLAGFDRIVHPSIVEAFGGRIMNIHPSLLPAFAGGLHAQADAFDYGVKIAGCTVHFVTNEIDAGPIILQGVVPVRDDDNADILAARILSKEHVIFPLAIRLYAEDKLRIVGRRVLFKDSIDPPGVLCD
jgi:phosphoribosylglycinamide formyltransferase 1